MAKTKTKKFDVADYLNDPEIIAAHLNEALQSGDAEEIGQALGTVARAHGMTRVSQETGLARESLYKSLGGGSLPSFDTVQKVVGAFGFKLVVEPSKAA